MLSTIDLRGRALTSRELRDIMPRAAIDVAEAVATVAPILADVRARGAAAVLEYGERFDGVVPPALRVTDAALADALAGLDPAVREALDEAIARVRAFHEATVPPGVSVTSRPAPP